MQAITKLLRNKKRGISTVIVVMLSLVLIVTIVGNVILWSYQMNQIDWEKIQEKIEIIDIQSVNNSWIQNPNGYILGGSTNWISGDISNLIIDDDDTMAFSSYFSGEDLQEFVGLDSSDIDSSFDKGIHSNFTAQQYGPDSVYDTLIEENTADANGLLFLFVNAYDGVRNDWTRVGVTPYLNVIDYDSNYVSSAKNNYEVGDFGFDDSGLSFEVIQSVTIQLFAKQSATNNPLELFVWDGLAWVTLGLQDPSASFGWINYTATALLDSWTKIDGAKIYMKSATGNGLYEVDCARLMVDYVVPANYELDLEVQWTDLNFNHLNEELCIYCGILDDENLQVDYWTGSDWETLFNDLNSGWNNVSISNYLESQKFTIRFKSTSEINDVIEDSWNIDVVLLHLWTKEHLTEMEFLGQSNTEEWSKLIWNSDIAWSIGSVNVIVQLYNFTSENYSTNGSGYLNYISNNLPDIKENKTQLINLESTDFRNETGFWKIKITGIANTDIPFNSEIDWIQITETQFGALVTFRNEGSLTSHMISFWVNNSTRHQRYEIETFVSPGETISKLFENIILPDEPFTTKVSTERGNLSVFSSD